MSRKSDRKSDRIDYKIYHETGQKVSKSKVDSFLAQKVEKLSIMSDQGLKDQEAKICFRFERFLDENDFDLLTDEAEVESSLSECKSLIEQYGDTHIELRRELGETYGQNSKS